MCENDVSLRSENMQKFSPPPKKENCIMHIDEHDIVFQDIL